MLCMIKKPVVTNMKNAVPSLEFMPYQHDDFGEQLVAKVEWLRLEGTYSSKAIDQSGINELINSRFKTNITFRILRNDRFDAFMTTPSISSNHPLEQLFQRSSNTVGRLIADFGEKGKAFGSVNLENATVSGIFSKIPVGIYITDTMFGAVGLTPREIAGAIAHEIGHYVTYCWYLLNTAMGSFITTKVAAMAAGAPSDKERKFIIANGAKILGIDNLAIEPLLHQTAEQNAATLQTLYIRDTANLLRSETGASVYEAKSSEQLADGFAVRFGFAKDLALIHSKLGGGRQYNVSGSRLAVLKAMADVGVAVANVATFGTIMPRIQEKLLKYPSDLLSPYDRDDQRVRLLKQGLVQLLKEADPKKKDFVNQLIKDIDATEKVEKSLTYQESVTAYLQQKLIPFYGKTKRDQELQKTVEDLIFNDMFVNASKLKQLGESK